MLRRVIRLAVVRAGGCRNSNSVALQDGMSAMGCGLIARSVKDGYISADRCCIVVEG